MLIVTPTYNYSEGLVNLLEVCPKSQKIYVFDNSPNESIRILCKKYDNIRYFYSKKTNITNNWNYALSNSKDEFLLFLHDDEYINQKDLKKLLSLEKDRKTIYFFKNNVFKKNIKISSGFSLKFKLLLLKIFPKLILFMNFIGPTGSFIFYNNSNNQYFFDDRLVWLVDTDFFYRIFHKKKYSHLDISINTHLKTNSITSNLGFKKRILEIKELLYIKKKYKINFFKFFFYIIFSVTLRLLNKFFFKRLN